MKPIYGTTIFGTELILDLWLKGDTEKACKELMMQINVNKPETPHNNERNAYETIIAWIEKNFN